MVIVDVVVEITSVDVTVMFTVGRTATVAAAAGFRPRINLRFVVVVVVVIST
jgi:hypothetical protein